MTLRRERLRDLLDYNHESGHFTWRSDRPGGVKKGDRAGCAQENGVRRSVFRRWQIVIDRKHYKAHRLAWFYVYGTWPKMLDHINGNGHDNRISNLREATPADNMANSLHPKGTTGFRGVSYYKNGYMAQISVNGRSVYLGRFRTPEEAHEAWCRAAHKFRGDFARTD